MLVGHTVVTVVTKEQNPVLPSAGSPVPHICHGLVDHRIGIGNGTCRDASDTQIHLVTQMVAALAVVKESHIILKHIGLDCIDRIERLIA